MYVEKYIYFKGSFIFILYVVLFACLCISCMQYLQTPEEGDRSPFTGIADDCVSPRGCWEWHPWSIGRAASALTPEASPSSEPDSRPTESGKEVYLVQYSLLLYSEGSNPTHDAMSLKTQSPKVRCS